jgi:YHS domain-containing protein
MLLILRIVLVLLIVRAVLMLVRGVIQGASTGPQAAAPTRRGQLLRDPVCGVYVTADKAITERSGAGTAYFCSEKCRQAWIRR